MADSIKIVGGSRLKFAVKTILGGVTFFDSEPPAIALRQDDSKHDVLGLERIDILAYQYYGATPYWWAIAKINNMGLLPTELVSGSKIVIPNKYGVLTLQ
jgi:translation initiation factor 2B subunit (eIF-2B alpha/beta/delta family)